MLALERELAEVVEECSEPAVAERKLAYWHDELARGIGGAPSHPVTRALAEAAPRALDAAGARTLLEGVHHRICHPQYRDAAELDADCRATAGQVARACARALGAGPDAATGAEAVAMAAERVRLLRLPRRAGLPPHTGVPLDALADAGATPGQVDAGGTSPALARLRARLLADAGDALQRAERDLESRRGFAATTVAIARAQLRALRRGGFEDTGRARPALPLTLLWVAWRHRP